MVVYALLVALIYLFPQIFPSDRSSQHLARQSPGEGILLTLPQTVWVESFIEENNPSFSHVSDVLGLKGGKILSSSAASIRWPHLLLGKM